MVADSINYDNGWIKRTTDIYIFTYIYTHPEIAALLCFTPELSTLIESALGDRDILATGTQAKQSRENILNMRPNN